MGGVLKKEAFILITVTISTILICFPQKYQGRLEVHIRELKQQRRGRLRKRRLKSEFALLYQSSGKEKEKCCLVFSSSTDREIRYFHVVVVQ